MDSAKALVVRVASAADGRLNARLGKPVVSKNTNELKTSSPGCFGIDVSTLDWPMGARILGHEHADPVLCQNSALLK